MYKLLFFLGVGLCFLTSILHAVEGESPATDVSVITPYNVRERVLQANPDLQAARYWIEEAKGRHLQAGRLTNPDLDIEFAHSSNSSEREFTIGVSQRFPLTGRLRYERLLTEAEIRQVEEEVREVERQLVLEAHQIVVEILGIQQRRKLLEKQTTILKDFADYLNEAASRGEGAVLDARQAQVEMDLFALEGRQLRVSESTAIGRLKPLLGIHPKTNLTVQGDLSAPIIPDWQIDLTQRPDYQAMASRVEVARHGVALEEARKYEDVEFGVFAGFNREKEDFGRYESETMLGVKLSVPLPLWNRNQGARLEAHSRQRRMESQLAAVSQKIVLETDSLRTQMLEWARLYQQIEQDLLPLANEQAKLAEEAYREGMMELQTVFRMREKRVQLDMAQLNALCEFHLARVRYEAASNKL